MFVIDKEPVSNTEKMSSTLYDHDVTEAHVLGLWRD